MLIELAQDKGAGSWLVANPIESLGHVLNKQVFHPNCASCVNMGLQAAKVHHENIKKRNHNERVMNVERGSLTPIIFSTTGGAGPETDRHLKRIAKQIAMKRKEEYSHVIQYIRTRLRFNLIRIGLVAIRGERGKSSKASPISTIEFGMLPTPKD